MSPKSAATYTTAVVALCTMFVVQTVLNGVLADALVVAAGVGGVVGAAFVAGGVRSVAGWRALDRRALMSAGCGGVLAWAGAPLVVMSQRASDAPPGAEVAFFTLTAFGLAVVALSLAVERALPWPVTAAAALMAAVGGAVLLASWEFPSSFSPFVRFPDRHALMLAAGVAFAAGSHLIARSVRPLGHHAAFAASAFAAAVPGLALAIAGVIGSEDRIPRNSSALIVLAFVSGLFAWSWTRLAADDGGPRAAVVLLLGPAALTGLSAVERATRILGPDPVDWPAAVAAIAVSVTACVTLWLSAAAPPEPHDRAVGTGFARGFTAAGWLMIAGGVASLWLPAVRGEVEGAFGEIYRASWVMPGAEAASGWLVAAAASLAGALAFMVARRRVAPAVAFAAAVCVGTAAAAYSRVAATPLRTATRWIPADVQQSYGTEYARLAFEAIHEPARLIVLAMAVTVAVAAAVVVWNESRLRSKGTA